MKNDHQGDALTAFLSGIVLILFVLVVAGLLAP